MSSDIVLSRAATSYSRAFARRVVDEVFEAEGAQEDPSNKLKYYWKPLPTPTGGRLLHDLEISLFFRQLVSRVWRPEQVTCASGEAKEEKCTTLYPPERGRSVTALLCLQGEVRVDVNAGPACNVSHVLLEGDAFAMLHHAWDTSLLVTTHKGTRYMFVSVANDYANTPLPTPPPLTEEVTKFIQKLTVDEQPQH